MLDLPPDTASSKWPPVPREVHTVPAPRVRLANCAISNAELLQEESESAEAWRTQFLAAFGTTELTVAEACISS